MTLVANCRRYQRHRRQICHWPVSTTPAANFATSFPYAVDTGGKFVNGVNDTGGKLPPVSTTPVANCHRYQRHRQQICHRCCWHRWKKMGTVGSFRIFSKIRGDICKSRCTTGVNDTGGKFATGVNDTCGKLPPVSTTPAANLPLSGINDTGGKFCHQFPLCCWHRWQICRRCQRYRRQIATGINDTGSKWEQYQAAYTVKWTWRQKCIYMLTLLPKGALTK